MNRIGLKIACFLAAVLIWIQVAATSVVETTVDLPLRVTGLAEGLTIAGSDLPQRVAVRVRGSKLGLLTHKYFGGYMGEVRVNLTDREPGPAYSYQLGTDDVFTEAEVLRLDRDVRLRLHVDEVWTRLLPVEPTFTGSWPTDVGLLAPPRVVPDSVTVSGPSRFVGRLESMETAPVARGRLRSSTRQRVALELPHPEVHAVPGEVEVEVDLAPLVERTLANVPVVPLVDAGRPEVSVSPPLADVMVRGVADSVRALTTARITVTTAVGDRPVGVYLLPGQVVHPPWLTLLGLSPAEFRVIVGDPPLDTLPVPHDTTGTLGQAGGGRP